MGGRRMVIAACTLHHLPGVMMCRRLNWKAETLCLSLEPLVRQSQSRFSLVKKLQISPNILENSLKTRKLHMIGNAHIDPVWLWQWQEGFQEVKASFRSALDRMKEYPEFNF